LESGPVLKGAFEMKRTVLLTCAAMGMALAAASAANAAVFDFSIPSGDQGVSHVYTSGLLSTTLTAFGTPAADLWGKANGGDENGVGMTNDTSGDHEIQVDRGFIQIDTLGLSSIQLAFNSTTEDEEWSVFGGNVAGTLGAFLVSGMTESTTAVLAPFRYYDVMSTSSSGGGNILLRSMTATGSVTKHGGIPEPTTWAMMVIGFGGLGAVLRRRHRAPAVP
jgi:hypothetical protein